MVKSVKITVLFPNGSTTNTSPQVISPGCSLADGGAERISARSPPELVMAASTPGYLSNMASATRSPTADSCNRVGSLRMSAVWVPMTLLRSTAVSALASSTMACTSARGVTPMSLAIRVAPPAQVTSPSSTMSCSTE
jgi:hypothetical protein